MIPLRLVGVPTMMLLAICLLLGLAAAAPLPGVAWSKLEIWGGSAAADVWLYSGDYLDFRKYALAGLSDLGFLIQRSRFPTPTIVRALLLLILS